MIRSSLNKHTFLKKTSSITTVFPFLQGNQRYTGVNYSGVLHVNSDQGIDYIGIVFGYQSTKKFYVAMWRHQNINLYNDTYKAAIKGIQIKVNYFFFIIFMFF